MSTEHRLAPDQIGPEPCRFEALLEEDQMAIHAALLRCCRALALASLAGLAAAGFIPASAHAAHNHRSIN